MSFIDCHAGWNIFFHQHWKDIQKILQQVEEDGEYYPKKINIFKCFEYYGPTEIQLVLLGQDPYIGVEEINGELVPQACGLSFGVSKQHRIPPSLLNIYKEIQTCYPQSPWPGHGCLERWAKEEKILLLNAALTVKPNQSNSHAHLWYEFTDKVIQYISEVNNGTIFLLMGNFAKSKKPLIDIKKHKIFETVHPSPLSASRGFFGCRVFLEINQYRCATGKKQIQWF